MRTWHVKLVVAGSLLLLVSGAAAYWASVSAEQTIQPPLVLAFVFPMMIGGGMLTYGALAWWIEREEASHRHGIKGAMEGRHEDHK